MALGGDAGRNYGKPAALSGGERGAGGAAMHGELNLSDRGGGNLSDVAGRSGTRLAGGGGWGRRKAMDKLERVLGVMQSLGIRLADWR
jgi:hypothetical protein